MPHHLRDRLGQLALDGRDVVEGEPRRRPHARRDEVRRRQLVVRVEFALRLRDEFALLLKTSNTTVKRPANLDPGYIEQAKVVLASTKNFYHRIYLGGGIFGEVTMHFKNNTYQFFPWTYPDYKSKDYQDFFLRVRQIFRSQLRGMCLLNREE